MAARSPVGLILGSAAAIGGAYYVVARYSMAHSIGDDIPEKKAQLRTQGAQGEMLKAGENPEKVAKLDKVETHGGDKGLKRA